MKKLLVVILVGLFSTNVFAEYVHVDNPQEILNQLPQARNYSDGVISNGNFRQLAMRKSELMLSEGFREITVDNSPSYDSEIQTADNWVVTIFATHAEKTRTITNKSLNAVKKTKGRQLRAEGRAMLNAKYSDDWEDGYSADFLTLKNYYINTIKPLIIAASTLQEVKNINNGDEYTWPTLPIL